jgi:hypothetical protein
MALVARSMVKRDHDKRAARHFNSAKAEVWNLEASKDLTPAERRDAFRALDVGRGRPQAAETGAADLSQVSN